MNDKPVAGIVTALVVAPLALLCCLGPLALSSALAAAAGWLGGLGVFGSIGAVLVVAAVGYALLRRRARLSPREGLQIGRALFGPVLSPPGAARRSPPEDGTGACPRGALSRREPS